MNKSVNAALIQPSNLSVFVFKRTDTSLYFLFWAGFGAFGAALLLKEVFGVLAAVGLLSLELESHSRTGKSSGGGLLKQVITVMEDRASPLFCFL